MHSADRRVWKMVIVLALSLVLPSADYLYKANAQQTRSIGAEHPRITALRAYLYYHVKGDFSQQDLLSGHMALWNVIGGAGDADAPSSAILALVTVQHSMRLDRNVPSVKLSVRYGNRTTSNQTVSLAPFANVKGEMHIPFLIYNTGCERLQVTATLLIGSRNLHSLTRTADFKCGE
jgi:hypothetical protein